MISDTQHKESAKSPFEQHFHTTVMKTKVTRLLASLVVFLTSPITFFYFAEEANAQVAYEQLEPHQQVLVVCNGLMQLINKYPNELGLRIGVRECDVRLYNVRLCMASGGDGSCWETLTHPVTSEGDEIIERERNQGSGSYLRIGG